MRTPPSHSTLLVSIVFALLLAAAVPVGSSAASVNEGAYKADPDTGDGPFIVKRQFLEESARITDYGAEVARELLMTAFYQNITEGEIQDEVAAKMVEKGSSEYVEAFKVIVASGDQSAIPHGDSSDDDTNLILPGEVVVVDLGARYRGYCTDLTRTFFIGQPTSEMMEIYNITLEAQEVCIQSVEVGATGHEVDKAARDVIDSYGYAENFTHGVGHGIGVYIHMYPYLGPGSDDILFQSTDMAVTVEPGIYLEGRFGVRIEDDVQVLRVGPRVITSAPKSLEDAILLPHDGFNETPDHEPGMPRTEGLSFSVLLLVPLGLVPIVILAAVVVKKIILRK